MKYILAALGLVLNSQSAYCGIGFDREYNCKAAYTSRALSDVINDDRYSEVKANIFHRDEKLVKEFEELPPWVQVDFLRNIYRRYAENSNAFNGLSACK